MKYCILLLLVWMAFNKAEAQLKASLVYEDTLCVNTERPLLLIKGTTVTIGCDAAYLINPRRYVLYQQLHQHIRELSVTGNCQPVIAAYEEALLETQASYDLLYKQYNHTDQLAAQWISESAQAMQHMQQTLAQAEQTIAQANQNLAEARQIVKEARKKNIASKALMGVGGIGIGLLTASLFLR